LLDSPVLDYHTLYTRRVLWNIFFSFDPLKHEFNAKLLKRFIASPHTCRFVKCLPDDELFVIDHSVVV
jgi:hypothetical protein